MIARRRDNDHAGFRRAFDGERRVGGAVVAVANDIRVIHIRGVSSRARPVFVEWHKHRGLWRYFSKFEAHLEAPLVALKDATTLQSIKPVVTA